MLLPPLLCFVIVRVYTRMTEGERAKTVLIRQQRRVSFAWLRPLGRLLGFRQETYEGTGADDQTITAYDMARDARDQAQLESRTAGLQRRAYTLPVFFFSFAYLGGLILMLPTLYLLRDPGVPALPTRVSLDIGGAEVLVPLIVLQAGFLGGAAYTAFAIITRLLNRDITPRLFLVTGIRLMLAPLGALLMYLATPEVLRGKEGIAHSSSALLVYLAAGGFPVTLLVTGAEALCLRLKIGKRRKTAGNRSTTLVEGVSIFVAQRLSEEGIDAIQQLAFCNTTDLAKRTRYPAQTVADWRDQAVLYLLTGDVSVPSEKGKTRKLYDLLDDCAGIRRMSAFRRRVYGPDPPDQIGRRDGGSVRSDLDRLFWQLGLLKDDQERELEIEQLKFMFVGFCEDALAIDLSLRRKTNHVAIRPA